MAGGGTRDTSTVGPPPFCVRWIKPRRGALQTAFETASGRSNLRWGEMRIHLVTDGGKRKPLAAKWSAERNANEDFRRMPRDRGGCGPPFPGAHIVLGPAGCTRGEGTHCARVVDTNRISYAVLRMSPLLLRFYAESFVASSGFIPLGPALTFPRQASGRLSSVVPPSSVAGRLQR
eukprot:gene12939-biopygen8201